MGGLIPDWQKGRMGGYFLKIIGEQEGFRWQLVPFIIIWALFSGVLILFLFTTFVVPFPRNSTKSEKKYTTVDKDGNVTEPEDLPSWMDATLEKLREAKAKKEHFDHESWIEPAEVYVTVIVPAYNEEKRLTGMLEEAVNLLEREYSNVKVSAEKSQKETATNGEVRKRKPNKQEQISSDQDPKGWEILIINDGSRDKTVEVAQQFARTRLLPTEKSALKRRQSGPWTHGDNSPPVNIPAGSIRIVTLEANRGKGGAVVHGMRHARGAFVLFADADGASDIKDLTKLVSACQKIEDSQGRAVAVGSRAHMVESEAVVKRSKLRNFLMHGFHLLLYCMTPTKTASIKDTQCGFKLFTRPSLPFIVPYMHMEGWIFDVELLMLAEFSAIPVAEVAIGWKEVVGSKLNVIKDSVGMAKDLAILRFCWAVGIYR